MWEFRLIWSTNGPRWWDAAWQAGVAALAAHSRMPEERPDTYLVLPDRPDVGLKIRGSGGEFEAKLRHRREDGWELWEKIPFFRWNDLEAARFSAALQQKLPGAPTAAPTALDGVKSSLRSASIRARELKVEKKRLQTRAADLSSALGYGAVDSDWLGELVEIHVAGTPVARSICFEAMQNTGGPVAIADSAKAEMLGYPEFLAGLA